MGTNPGEFIDPWGIAITNSILYILQIQEIIEFKHLHMNGNFLFLITYPEFQNIADLCINNNLLFVRDNADKNTIFVFRLENENVQ